jgi:hypothetical protein
VRFKRGLANFYASFTDPPGPTQTIPGNFLTPVLFNQEIWDYGNGYNPATGEYTIQYPGLYFFVSQVQFDNVTANTLISITPEVQLLGAGAWQLVGLPFGIYNVTTGNDPFVRSVSIFRIFDVTDKVRISVQHNELPNLDILTAVFTGQQIQHL